MERNHRLRTVTDSRYLDGIANLSDDELREKLHAVREEEEDVSYYRRILHARLDLLRGELGSRRGGDVVPKSLDALSDVLSDERERPHRGARPRVIPRAAREGSEEIERLLSEPTVAHIVAAPTSEVEAAAARLGAEEKAVSADRKRLHETIDALEAELAARYKAGLARPPV